jgi:hypothetical protein
LRGTAVARVPTKRRSRACAAKTSGVRIEHKQESGTLLRRRMGPDGPPWA